MFAVASPIQAFISHYFDVHLNERNETNKNRTAMLQQQHRQGSLQQPGAQATETTACAGSSEPDS
jgi:hypothetical protein